MRLRDTIGLNHTMHMFGPLVDCQYRPSPYSANPDQGSKDYTPSKRIEKESLAGRIESSKRNKQNMGDLASVWANAELSKTQSGDGLAIQAIRIT